VHQIEVNGARKLHAEAGGTLLAALAGQGILLPSVCGGRGICGRCRVKVLAGGGELNSKEQAKLSPDEQGKGIRLACQLRIAGDLKIEIP
jgi:Na+-transporting NADH:ubiquinone oxidoreductase subunit F